MRLEPVSNVNNKRTIGERLSNFVDSLLSWDTWLWLGSLIVGLGLVGYITSAWVLFFVHRSSYVAAGVLAPVSCSLGILAILRVPIALVLVWGGAAICATAFFSGYVYVLLP
jgi:hypothetical protein